MSGGLPAIWVGLLGKIIIFCFSCSDTLIFSMVCWPRSTLILEGPLIAGCTTVLFEGKPVGTPDAGAYWRVIRDHKVKSLFTAPTGLLRLSLSNS